MAVQQLLERRSQRMLTDGAVGPLKQVAYA